MPSTPAARLLGDLVRRVAQRLLGLVALVLEHARRSGRRSSRLRSSGSRTRSSRCGSLRLGARPSGRGSRSSRSTSTCPSSSSDFPRLRAHALGPEDVDLPLQQPPLVGDLALPPLELVDQPLEVVVAQLGEIGKRFHVALSSGSAGRLIEAAGRSRVNLYLRFAPCARTPPHAPPRADGIDDGRSDREADADPEEHERPAGRPRW